jgi:uncharacterized membrane protein
LRVADTGSIAKEYLTQVVQWVAMSIEALGMIVVVVGIAAAGWYFFNAVGAQTGSAYAEVRKRLGRAILLGLELLVAADILKTVAFEPTLQRALTLALIVLIRTFLSFSLEVEITGHLPWHKSVAAEQH